MSRRPLKGCPTWCVADHAAEDDPGVVRHRGETRVVPIVLEGRRSGGPHGAELFVELTKQNDESGWLYLGDGWTGFSLSPESAARLAAALGDVVADDGTLGATGL